MSDELPTEERLHRIERGVQRRIGLRRTVARRVAVGAAAVVLVAGGFALVRPVLATSTATSAGSAAESGAAAGSSTTVAVLCHGARTATVRVHRSGLPASAIAACAVAGRAADARPQDAGGAATSSTPPTGVLCRAKDGALHVYPGPPSTCAAHGLLPYPS